MFYYLGLGSNIGDLEKNLVSALNNISKIEGCEIIKVSSFMRTKAWGYENQDDFLNLVVKVQSSIKPEIFLEILQEIEVTMGKKKLFKWGPRIIDIDIIFCDDLVINSEKLIVPHHYLHKRDFVLKPMVEIEPDFLHPLMKQSIKELYNDYLQEEKCQK